MALVIEWSGGADGPPSGGGGGGGPAGPNPLFLDANATSRTSTPGTPLPGPFAMLPQSMNHLEIVVGAGTTAFTLPVITQDMIDNGIGVQLSVEITGGAPGPSDKATITTSGLDTLANGSTTLDPFLFGSITLYPQTGEWRTL